MNSSSSLRRVIPAPLKPFAKAVYHQVFRWLLRIRFWCADRVSRRSPEIPVPPAMLRYRVSEVLSVSEFLRIGEGCAGLIRQRVEDMGIDIASADRVLDFGCGCGRAIAWFLRDFDAELHGADVDRDAIDWWLNEDGQRTLEAGAFVHRRSQKLKGLMPDWYQTSWHSSEYIVNRLAARFAEVRHHEVPDGLQDVVTARKAGA